jgi:hypothetical protein
MNYQSMVLRQLQTAECQSKLNGPWIMCAHLVFHNDKDKCCRHYTCKLLFTSLKTSTCYGEKLKGHPKEKCQHSNSRSWVISRRLDY